MSVCKQPVANLICQTVVALMQAVGMVNDHQTTCFRHKETGGV